MREDIRSKLKEFTRDELCLLNKSKLARRFNCDHRTVNRYLKVSSGEVVPRKSFRVYTSLLDYYKSIIVYKVDNYDSTAMAVYKFIQMKGYKGKYSTVADFVNKYKKIEIKKLPLDLKLHLVYKLRLIGDNCEVFKINIFLMVLGYSRMKFLKVTDSKDQRTLFCCIIDAFQYFGGIPKEILFDNMKTVIDRSKTSFSLVEFNSTFKYFADDSGFKPIACRPYRSQTKGKVEPLSKLTNRLSVYNGQFKDYSDLEEIVKRFMDEINNEVSQATNEIPSKLLSKDKEYFKPLPSLFSYVYLEKEYKVTKESMINYKGKKYSVPTKYIVLKLNITETSDGNISIYYNNDFIVCYSLSDIKYNYKAGHIYEIQKSDACKHLSDEQIDNFIKQNMTLMDVLSE